MSKAMRGKTCPVCGAWFIDNSSAVNGIYCRVRCRTVQQMRVQRQDFKEGVGILKHRVERYELAVISYCMECSPNLICPEAKCPLQPVSPLRPAYGDIHIRPIAPPAYPKLRRLA
jgi:hypothetical protein